MEEIAGGPGTHFRMPLYFNRKTDTVLLCPEWLRLRLN
jgi:hypothetical protein